MAPFVFDIGLHRGEDADFYLRKGYRVAAFEANPLLARSCRERFTGQIERNDLIVFEGLLQAAPGGSPARFFVNRLHSDWGTASPSWRDRNLAAFHAGSEEIDVPTICLGSTIAELGVPHYAKIDIEGMDHEILRAFGEFDERPAFISIESAKTNFAALEEEIELLATLGYRRFKAVQQRTIPGTTIFTATINGAPLTHTFVRHASGPFGDDLTGWTDRVGVLKAYRRIFETYRRWGDDSWLQRHVGRTPIAALQWFVCRPLPGWYDTHARLD